MFGKPEWFKERQLGWGLTPIAWQGWVYVVLWLAIIVLPFLFFAASGRGIESFIWITASLVTAGLDVRWILRGMNESEAEDVLYIDENETASQQMATRHYDLQLRR